MRKTLKTLFITIELIIALTFAAYLAKPPQVFAQATPSITIEPSSYEAERLGDLFNVSVNINNLEAADQLVAVQFRVLYNSSLLKVLSISEGPFLQQFNNSAEPPYTLFIDYNEVVFPYGPNVLIGILLYPNATGQWSNFPYGNGTLATITFKAVGQTGEPQPPASCALTLEDIQPDVGPLLNDTLGEIPYFLVNGTYEIQPFSFSYEPSTPRATQPVFFTAPETNQSLVYTWNFGDGTSPINATELTAGHVYASPGTYNVSLTCILNQTFASSPAIEAITILPNNQPTIEVTTDVGDLHFRGEIAEFSVLTTDNGQAVNATEIQALLYHSGVLYANLTSSLQPVATGFYTIPFNIPIDADTGRYTLLINAEYYDAEGTSQTGFQINPTLTSSIATIAEIKNDTATIITGSNAIKVSLKAINATVTSINGTTALLETRIGTLQTSLNAINATITGVKGDTATISTTLGTVTASLNAINATITGVKGDTATISTTLGTVTTKLDNIQSTATTTMYAAAILSALAVILAIAILILVIRARKK